MTALTAMIIRILLIILAVWLFRLFLAALLGRKRTGSSNKTSDSGKNMVKDPVCGMYMDPRLAVKYEIKNGTFYFCSEKCKKKFLEMPPGEEPGRPPSEK
jgi:uncharacterized protein